MCKGVKNLNSNFKDVKLAKELNTQTREYFYNVSIPDDDIVNIDSPAKNSENEKLKINTDEIIQDKEDKYWKTRVLFEYLFDNDLYESYKSDDDGNTIYHDLILSNSFIIFASTCCKSTAVPNRSCSLIFSISSYILAILCFL